MTRKYDYTPERHVRLMFKRQEGKCSVKTCRADIHLEKPRDFIIEHEQALGRGGKNRLKDKSLRCIPCAKAKTFHPRSKATTLGSDLYEIRKTDRMAAGGKTVKRPMRKTSRKIPSRPMGNGRGFEKGKRKMNWRKT